jgi:hypothetical protein
VNKLNTSSRHSKAAQGFDATLRTLTLVAGMKQLGWHVQALSAGSMYSHEYNLTRVARSKALVFQNLGPAITLE